MLSLGHQKQNLNKTKGKKRIMKKVMLLCALVLTMVSCSKESKVESGVKEFLSEYLNDAESYSPVSFEHKDSVRLTDIDNYQSHMKFIKRHNEMLAQEESDTSSFAIERKKEIKEEEAFIDEIKSGMGTKYAYSVVHTYRANNKEGGRELHTQIFVLDKDFEVTSNRDWTVSEAIKDEE